MCLICFFNDTATTEIYTLSLHDALPIFQRHLFGFLEPGHQVHDPVRIAGNGNCGDYDERQFEVCSVGYLLCHRLGFRISFILQYADF